MQFHPDASRLRARLRAEARFRWYGKACLYGALLLLALLLSLLIGRGAPGFMRAEALLPVHFSIAELDATDARAAVHLSPLRFTRLAQEAVQARFPALPPKDAMELVPSMASGRAVRTALMRHPEWAEHTQEVWLPVVAVLDKAVKRGQVQDAVELSGAQRQAAAQLQREGRLKLVWNTDFFTRGDSRQPEQAGFGGAVAGSLLTVAICLLAALPISVMAAVYLQEFARPGRWVDVIEVNINNLAAVPSIIYGLLGLAVYINLLGIPRSTPLAAGLTLALMAMPVLIISTRISLAAVPDGIRQAALALGASPVQMVWHHTLPMALPGIMTGTILALARVLGETAPLLMVGMVAFVADVPHGFLSPATAMPVQVYLWSTSPEAGFAEKTSAGICALLLVMLALNATAIYVRRRFETRW